MPPRIQVDPRVRFGKPCVAGTRITVQEVLELAQSRLSLSAIQTDFYPTLRLDDIRACLAFANPEKAP